MSILDGRDERQRAKVITERLREWKSMNDRPRSAAAKRARTDRQPTSPRHRTLRGKR